MKPYGSPSRTRTEFAFHLRRRTCRQSRASSPPVFLLFGGRAENEVRYPWSSTNMSERFGLPARAPTALDRGGGPAPFRVHDPEGWVSRLAPPRSPQVRLGTGPRRHRSPAAAWLRQIRVPETRHYTTGSAGGGNGGSGAGAGDGGTGITDHSEPNCARNSGP